MRKLISMFIITLLLLTMTACGQDSSEGGLARQPSDAICGFTAGAGEFILGITPKGRVHVWANHSMFLDEYEGFKEVSSWKKIVKIAVSPQFIVGLKSDGSVCCIKARSGEDCSPEWSDAVDIITGGYSDTTDGRYFACLKKDGTVECSGISTSDVIEEGRVMTKAWVKEDWTDIVKLTGTNDAIVGLKSDGTVVAAGANKSLKCEVDEWTEIQDICCTRLMTVGIKKDGTLVTANSGDPSTQVWTNWTDIVELEESGTNSLFGLRSDGTVVSSIDFYDLSGWKDTKKIFTFDYGVVGLKSDGTLEAFFTNDGIEYGCDMQEVMSWTDTVELWPIGAYSFMAVKSDGTILGTGLYNRGEEAAKEIMKWDLFDKDDLAVLKSQNEDIRL